MFLLDSARADNFALFSMSVGRKESPDKSFESFGSVWKLPSLKDRPSQPLGLIADQQKKISESLPHCFMPALR